MNLDSILNQVLVYDIETYAEYPDGREINIRTNFDDYLLYAKCKWFGCYSYKDNKEYYLETSKDRKLIMNLLLRHHILVGFNNEEFDQPIIINNGLTGSKKYNQVDCMKILGNSTFRDKNGYKFKGRGDLMEYKFKKNSLQHMAEVMKLDFQKSEIDYKIFKKDIYTDEEKKEIIKYLKNDVMANKCMFDKLWTYWMPFTEIINWKFVVDLSWIKSSIASLIYKSACHSLNTEPTYSEKKGKLEDMGGRVLEPKYEEVSNAWYIDFSSLYPHIFCMFNLFGEVSKDYKNAWHGNDLFKVKGYYDVSYQHTLAKAVQEKLKQRTDLKKNDPENPMIYTLKIWLNGLYGIARSTLFEKVHTENCGWDCCWLGQQIQEYTQKELIKKGYECVYGDTDSLMIIGTKKAHNDEDYIKICLKKIIGTILENVPFSVETFTMDIETFIEYMLFPFSDQAHVDEDTRKILNSPGKVEGYIKDEEDGKNIIIDTRTNKIVKRGRSWIKERKGKKKNYLYLYKKENELKAKLVGLPIKKDNATNLGIKIYKEVLEPKILKEKKAKFPREFIDMNITNYLKNKEIMQLISREFKVKPFNTYKIPKGKTEPTGIYSQISKGYFNDGEGIINLIKNKKIGKAGKGTLYCTVDEAVQEKLTIDDLDLEKLYNELEPFIEYVEVKKT